MASHLDLEGVCYLKITRSGAQECFAADVTSDILKSGGHTYKSMHDTFWRDPVMAKWARVQKEKA